MSMKPSQDGSVESNPAVAMRTKSHVVGRNVALFFTGDFFDYERVFVIRLRIERLSGVCHKLLASLNAVIGENTFIVPVDGGCVRSSVKA